MTFESQWCYDNLAVIVQHRQYDMTFSTSSSAGLAKGHSDRSLHPFA